MPASGNRVACVLIPFLLSLASLVCIALVFIGNISASSPSRDLYFFRVNTTTFTLATTAGIDVKDWYDIGLWNYCAGTNTNSTSIPTICSSKTAFFWFDPLTVWGIKDTALESFIPAEWTDGLSTYHTVSKVMTWLYLIAVVATALTLVLSVFAFCSRCGSLLTSLTGAVATLFTVSASAVATALFSTLRAFIDEKLGGYGVKGSLGTSMFVVTWLASAFAITAGLFWTLSICCCGGHRARGDKRGRGLDQSAAYERVPSPYVDGPVNRARGDSWYGQQKGAKDVPLQQRQQGAGLEPYREV